MVSTDQVCAILGGDSPGISTVMPWIRCGVRSPPFPVAVKCRTEQEACEVMRLQPIIEALSDKSSNDIANFFLSSSYVKGVLNDGMTKFWAVNYGHRIGIFRAWQDSMAAKTYLYPQPHKTLLHRKHQRSSSMDPNTTITVAGAPSDDTTAVSTTITAAININTVSTAHIRTLSGITQTLAGANMSPVDSLPVERPPPSMGPVVDSYLAAHGYQALAIYQIYHAYTRTSLQADFVAELSEQGLPQREAQWLWNWVELP
ncbi:hypothetical protein BD779DRAFT_1668381 [Infundibulicybe gibba]|nr:hypothetical protein BD779DRAFT_1668381 [Infundibulicybe gibba]